jgi:hypothetical protein
MKPWTRDETKDWIKRVETRITDIDYYLKKTIEFCEFNDVYDNRTVLVLSMMTVIWVSHMRNEYVSYNEMAEILGIDDVAISNDKIYDLGVKFSQLDHDQMLKVLLKTID